MATLVNFTDPLGDNLFLDVHTNLNQSTYSVNELLDFSSKGDGTYLLQLSASDDAGFNTSQQNTFLVDRNPPSIGDVTNDATNSTVILIL